MRETLANLLKDPFVDLEAVTIEQAMLFEDDPVIDAVQTAGSLDEILPGLAAFMQVFNQGSFRSACLRGIA
jgi:hypothetical protein